jgi:uncharacterized protein (DUF58 family)
MSNFFDWCFNNYPGTWGTIMVIFTIITLIVSMFVLAIFPLAFVIVFLVGVLLRVSFVYDKYKQDRRENV